MNSGIIGMAYAAERAEDARNKMIEACKGVVQRYRRNYDHIPESLERYYKLLEDARSRIAARSYDSDGINILSLTEGTPDKELYTTLFTGPHKATLRGKQGMVCTMKLLREMSELERWATVDAVETHRETTRMAESREEELPLAEDLFKQ